MNSAIKMIASHLSGLPRTSRALAGNIVLTVEGFSQALTSDQIKILADVHMRKIDLADEIFVLDVDGYIGDSTRREIEYAKAHGKSVRYLSSTQS